MPKYVKPELLNLVWASDALPADKPSPDSSGEFSGAGITVDVAEGWTQVKPPYEVENWIQNQQSQFNAYINQLGVPEWDTDTEYQSGKSYVQGSDNRIYKCILTHSGRNPASGNPSYWELFEGNRQATTTARGTVELATTAEAQAGTSDSLAVTPSALASRTATESRTGVIEIATQSETNNGSDDTRAVTPKKMRWGVSFSKGTNSAHLALPSWLGGFIIQAGLVPNFPDNTEQNVSLPMTFSSNMVSVTASLSTLKNGSSYINTVAVKPNGLGSITIKSEYGTDSQETKDVHWIAFGW